MHDKLNFFKKTVETGIFINIILEINELGPLWYTLYGLLRYQMQQIIKKIDKIAFVSPTPNANISN